MAEVLKPTPQQVGRGGELLVQYKLLKFGIDSAPMTTDYGIDLLAFHPQTHQTVTIQVKASSHHKDTTSWWVEWNMPKKCVAQYVAVADVERNKIWLFTKERFQELATSTGGEGLRLWWYLPGHKPETATVRRSEEDFVDNEMDAVIPKLFSE